MATKLTEDHLLNYAAFIQVIDSLQHYNRIQVTYRIFASTWLLATFFGIGYSLSSYEVNLPFNPLLIVALICLASAIGIFLIWYMDLIITERFIATIVYQGIDLENQNPWLPQILNNVVQLTSLLGYVSLKSVFYIGCFIILTSTVGAAISIYLYLNHNFLWIYVPFLTVIIMVFFSYILVFSSKSADPYHRLNKIGRKDK